MPLNTHTHCFDLFIACSEALDRGELMVKRSRSDKEYFFQDWFEKCLIETLGTSWSSSGRNGYPDFILSNVAEGYELKGLSLPSRKTIDSNSRYPTEQHRGRSIYYVFGRYPSSSDLQLPLSDLLICHASFINTHQQDPKNKSFLGYGSYGDLLVRDRKMYVFPLPFYTTVGTQGNRTLILPSHIPADPRAEVVGQLCRVETAHLLIGYHFDFRTNTLTPEFIDNPRAGTEHHFTAYRVAGRLGDVVSMVANLNAVLEEDAQSLEEDL
jgi:hypothetical protein